MTRAAWPPRTALCLDCRTAAIDGQPCPAGPSHRVRALGAPAGREQVLQTVWGPKPLRQRMRQIGRAGVTGGGTGGVLSSMGDCGGCVGVDLGFDALGAFIVAIVVVASVFMAVAWLFQAIQGWRRRRAATLSPHGATAAAAAPPREAGRAGKVIGAPIPSPLSGAWCVGFDVRMRHGRRAITLRDAATVGFDVALDDGTRVRIPPGPLIVDCDDRAAVALSCPHLERYLQTLDPARAEVDDLDPFPRHRIEEATIRPGDRVEVLGRLRPVADGAAAPAGYREPAATIWIPDGVPSVRMHGVDPGRL